MNKPVEGGARGEGPQCARLRQGMRSAMYTYEQWAADVDTAVVLLTDSTSCLLNILVDGPKAANSTPRSIHVVMTHFRNKCDHQHGYTAMQWCFLQHLWLLLSHGVPGCRQGFAAVTFVTDGNQELTCGQAPSTTSVNSPMKPATWWLWGDDRCVCVFDQVVCV